MLNKVTLIGRLVADPEVRFLPNGGQVTNIRLATSRKWKDKDGTRKEESEFHRIVFFSKLAEIVSEYLKKGSLCYIEGRIKTQKYQDKDGSDRYSTEIIAENMTMLDSRQEPMPEPKPDNKPAQAQQDFDDDIPF